MLRKDGVQTLGTRWVGINSGGTVHLEYRSRLVAQEIEVDKRVDLFAAMPPLQAKKRPMSLAVMKGLGLKVSPKKKGMTIDIMRVCQAYFHAPARKELYLKMLDEDYE